MLRAWFPDHPIIALLLPNNCFAFSNPIMAHLVPEPPRRTFHKTSTHGSEIQLIVF